MIKRLNILCLLLLITNLFFLITFIIYQIFSNTNNTIYNYCINKISRVKKINDICVNKLSEEIFLIENKSYNNFNKPSLVFCKNVLSTSTRTQSLITASYFYKAKANSELKEQIKRTKENFSDNKDFLDFYMQKNKSIETNSENIINKEFPNPLEGRETHIYITFYQTALIEKQKVILQGLIYDYCFNNHSNKSCDNILFK